MRITITLDEDVVRQIRRVMAQRGTEFKETVNELLRRGLREHEHVETCSAPTFALEVRGGIDLGHALRVAGELEDAELVRKHERGK